jgi:hypothetical protein
VSSVVNMDECRGHPLAVYRLWHRVMSCQQRHQFAQETSPQVRFFCISSSFCVDTGVLDAESCNSAGCLSEVHKHLCECAPQKLTLSASSGADAYTGSADTCFQVNLTIVSQ